MPLPDDRKIVKLADELVDTMRATFKTPENYRPVHAKGQLCKGVFYPSREASKLSKAPIFRNTSTPLIMRYSTDTGLKNLPDNGEIGSRGFALRFVLSKDGHQHYDITTNNAFGFVVSTGEGFLDQFKAMRDDKMEDFLNKYPHERYFMENQSPSHSYSFATEQWHSIHAFKFTRTLPGIMKHSKAEAAKQGKNYQFDDLEWRMKNNKPIKYRLLAQLATESDEVNDSTKVWPETNDFADMGEIIVEKLWTMDEGES
ncbi:catalase-like domain-containing protein [Pestalotiopsis sp. NC0098]|nr:catalase-like domain-containing protein [Pestalotiopsis sp. NC0098]